FFHRHVPMPNVRSRFGAAIVHRTNGRVLVQARSQGGHGVKFAPARGEGSMLVWRDVLSRKDEHAMFEERCPWIPHRTVFDIASEVDAVDSRTERPREWRHP